MQKIKEIKIPGYEKVFEIINPEANLHCFIAIHDSTLGPALGGIRMYPYKTPQEALQDVLLLAKSMTYKSALAELGLGGGKCVIMGNPRQDKTETLLLAIGEAVDQLHGQYLAAEDVGMNPEDLLVIRRKTSYVAALPTDKSSGDPSRYTAHGVFRGIQAVAQKLWGNVSLRNKKIAIQGLGHVGGRLAALLFWEGADLLISDIDVNLVKNFEHFYGAEIIPPENFNKVQCDILCPCAMGGTIDEASLSALNCLAIAGAANNPLSQPILAEELFKKGILFAPDYVINSGGIINAACEFRKGGYDPKLARDKMNQIYDRLLYIFERSEKEKKSTYLVAEELVKYNLKHHIGQRKGTLETH